MAKRKRLTPAQTGYLSPSTGPDTKPAQSPGTPRGPIAQVSGDAAITAAFEELAAEMRQARDDGRLIQKIPLDQVAEDYLVRDRVAVDDDEMQSLMKSLGERGQQHPVELVQLAPGSFGLISGWRRLNALRRLRAESGDHARFGHVQAILRRPDTAADAYLAMVEENEIRVGLSYYERARIAAKAVEQGVYADEKAALLALFSNASRAKRSKIRSFLPIYHALDGALRCAGAIPERLGLRLSKALEEDADFAGRLQGRLKDTAPATPEAEAALINAELDQRAAPKPTPKKTKGRAKISGPPMSPVTAEMTEPGVIVLRGAGATPALLKRLNDWLAGTGQAAGSGQD
jgi:ParB-like chromosome segregation protein Spo0J